MDCVFFAKAGMESDASKSANPKKRFMGVSSICSAPTTIWLKH
jgi:hypothetical protein